MRLGMCVEDGDVCDEFVSALEGAPPATSAGAGWGAALTLIDA